MARAWKPGYSAVTKSASTDPADQRTPYPGARRLSAVNHGAAAHCGGISELKNTCCNGGIGTDESHDLINIDIFNLKRLLNSHCRA
jgi:hypothetical protein